MRSKDDVVRITSAKGAEAPDRETGGVYKCCRKGKGHKERGGFEDAY